ncbi:hypothetical protein MCOR25_004129 [Pyricularia grisea]|uniref:Acyltransferase 3 domain-containing protein n=1 Tax=Pyricularia grisea TaxID=148305 RepID=A0A6P8B1F4_PYRGI|nr:uncharacterized protein PgNI_07394 [Pyricularia grisea]KAI6370586.1 hypothetical protein MCOR25_004129 [Pyricularia grisea]TLD08666.1 hypothetical protein PgNI_07394 [Pyricularia grisea]
MFAFFVPDTFRRGRREYLAVPLLTGEGESESSSDAYAEKRSSSLGERPSVDDTLIPDSPTESRILDFGDEKVFDRRLARWGIHPKVWAALAKFRVLAPSFLVDDDEDKPPVRLHPSAWLDGLRGTAAFLVVWHHSSLVYFSWRVHEGYGSSQGTEWSYLIQLPIIRLIISGAPQVKIFFAISGYALSYKPLKLARAGRFNEWASALSSSIFRRHPRLFLPAVAILFVGTFAGWLQLYGGTGATEGDKWNAHVAIPVRAPPYKEAFGEHFADWARTVLSITNPLATDQRRGATPYDWNLWTLPMEFDCSLVVFLCLAAFARLRSILRLFLTAAVATYAIWFTHWGPFLFIAGMFICDLHFELEDAGSDTVATLLPSVTQPARAFNHGTGFCARWRRTLNRLRARAISTLPRSVSLPSARVVASLPFTKTLWVASLLTSLWLLSVPENNRGGKTSPFYMVLTSHIPANYGPDDENHWWLSLGAVLLVFTIDRAGPFLQRAFTSRAAQYLGKISYALYLVHGPIVFSLGWHLGRWCTALTGRETTAGWGAGIVLAYMGLWPVLFWVADIASRLVDVKSVEFSKWSYDRMVKKVV